MVTSAYIHIPFCRRRCFYCDFAITVIGEKKRGDTSNTMATYTRTLLKEIAATPIYDKRPLKTVFFGGGTPSLLSVTQVEEILAAIAHRFGIAPNAEITMEMDPATFDLDHIRGYKSAGVNRVSLGVQAFKDELLAAAGRFHRREDIFHAVELLRQAGIENFSLDLILGLPYQVMKDWQAALIEAITLGPKHLSIYDLIVEPQTAFSRYYISGQAPLPSDHLTVEMYRVARSVLSANGYEHYEICNYAKPSYASQHNLTYWRCQQNYGFGMGATSYLNHQRIDRPRTQQRYQVWVDAFIQNGGRTADPVIDPEEQVVESIMMGLRLPAGIALGGVHQIYGEKGLQALGKAIAPHLQNGWLTIKSASVESASVESALLDDSNAIKLRPTDRIQLSDPEGFLMSNVVITDAFNALEDVAHSE
ncbi:putative oxygen-independent coproporphyrinogen III oxidase [Synechococcus sp. PCC 7335]|uniref:radical SAM family heme chaperone HemW n=1 Tax=Synechococcus sp. (strain ATCC 29403 / PCC 7335) TaxID=91464 RepID=UPI00017EB8AF|nr:radical SAM family heme chaperone HemW [Synechococcus sp. PCC 7335]EDX84841.1 putative oxygen-independent coproporphyrinogen III oxidase [Synechococcus sp. PCC 7335]